MFGNADAPCEHVLRDTECHDTMFASHVRVEGVVRGFLGFRFSFLFQKERFLSAGTLCVAGHTGPRGN